MEFIDLPRLTPQEIELALNLGEGNPEDARFTESQMETKERLKLDTSNYVSDSVQRTILLNHGWRIRHSYEVSNSPDAYQSYIQNSRGEYSCVKPSCLKFQNAWISDRTICYLASGKPVVIQDTGPSSFLPDGNGVFRFSSVEEAVNAFEVINSNYEKQCRAARNIAEAYFDAKKINSSCL